MRPKQTTFMVAVSVILIGMITFVGCSSGLSSADLQMRASDTAAAITVQALGTRLAGPPTKTPVPPTPTVPTPTPTRTNSPSPAPTTAVPTITPTVLTIDTSCDQAEFISESIPDDAQISQGTLFTQIWTIRNTGTCVWTTDYKFVFESGDSMTETTEIAFLSKKQTVPPGSQISIPVKLTAPDDVGEKIGFWKLQNAKGLRFGRGDAADPLWIKIQVIPETTAPFTVTSVKAYAIPNSYTGACSGNGYKITLMAKIRANKAGTVRYTWAGPGVLKEKDRDGTLVFYGAYEQTIFETITYFKGINYESVRLRIIEPNEIKSENYKYYVGCTH
jgi:hypothetical protein